MRKLIVGGECDPGDDSEQRAVLQMLRDTLAEAGFPPYCMCISWAGTWSVEVFEPVASRIERKLQPLIADGSLRVGCHWAD